MDQPNALVLFDIDGTLIRRAARTIGSASGCIREAAGFEALRGREHRECWIGHPRHHDDHAA